MADTLDLIHIDSTQNVQAVKTDLAISNIDGWKNIMSGMGTSRDKRRYTTYDFTRIMDSQTLTNLYIGDGLFARIIDTFSDDMTREWGKAANDPINKKSKKGIIEGELERLDAQSFINMADKGARLLGGSLLYIGAMDGKSPESPLNIDRIKSIEFLRVIDLPDILTYDCTYNEDITSANYGKIELYAIQLRVNNKWSKMYVHASRCIPFFGRRVPNSSASLSVDQKYWGLSEAQPAWEYLRDFTAAMGSVSHILLEFIIGKYKFSDLDEMLAKGNEGRLKTRVEAMEMTKSTIHSVLLGIDEEYTRDSATVTGIADLLDRFMMNLSAVTQYPVTKLFGRSPAGLNATGENDLKNYYDAVRSKQRANTRYIQNLIDMIASLKKLPGEYPWEWNPLFQLNEEQQANVKRIDAETARTYADADQRYLQEGVLLPKEVYQIRFKDDLGKKDFELVEEEQLQKELEQAEMWQEMNAKNAENVPAQEEGKPNDTPNTSGRNKEIPKNAN
jgi:phage-related protein (TIGR01555 family)